MPLKFHQSRGLIKTICAMLASPCRALVCAVLKLCRHAVQREAAPVAGQGGAVVGTLLKRRHGPAANGSSNKSDRRRVRHKKLGRAAGALSQAAVGSQSSIFIYRAEQPTDPTCTASSRSLPTPPSACKACRSSDSSSSNAPDKIRQNKAVLGDIPSAGTQVTQHSMHVWSQLRPPAVVLVTAAPGQDWPMLPLVKAVAGQSCTGQSPAHLPWSWSKPMYTPNTFSADRLNTCPLSSTGGDPAGGSTSP